MWEQYELDDTECEVVEAFIEALLDRDAIAMREVVYLVGYFIEDMYDGPESSAQAGEEGQG